MSGGQYLMLFMVALLLLWLSEDSRGREFKQFAFVMLLLLLCPLSLKVLCVYQTAFYHEENLWELLSVTALLAYGLVVAFFRMTASLTREYGRWKSATSKKKEKICEILVTVALTALLFLCGTLSPGKSVSAVSEDGGQIPDKVEQVLDALEIPNGESVFLLAPDEVLTWARIYSGAVLLPYGRNLWEIELSAYTYDVYPAELYELHGWINGIGVPEDVEVAWEEEFISRCASSGYDYLVFSAERDSEAALQTALKQQKNYVAYERTETYVIYKLR